MSEDRKKGFRRPGSQAMAAIQEVGKIEKPPVEMARMSLDLPVPLHKRLKIMAVEEGVSMSDLIRKWIEQAMKQPKSDA